MQTQDSIEQIIESLISEKLILLGIGNMLKGDDGFGSVLASSISGKVDYTVFDGGIAPENYIEKIIACNPEVILIVDAAHFNGRVGELKFVPVDEIVSGGISTHGLSPALLIEHLSNRCKAKIYFLACQPGKVNLTDEMSDEVIGSLSRLGELLCRKR